MRENFEWDEPFVQTNYYYGYQGDKKKDITIRVREKNDGMKLQVKIPKIIKQSLHIKEEYEKEIKKVYDSIDKEVLTQLTGYTFDESPKLKGSLKTIRCICKNYDSINLH